MFDFKKTISFRRGTVSARGVEELFHGCDDFILRRVSAGGGRAEAAACWLDGCVNAEAVAEDILRPFSRLECRGEAACRELCLRGGIWSGAVRERSTCGEVAADLAAGSAALIFDALGTALTFEIKAPVGRAVEAPVVEKAVLGAREAFVETLRTNTALVRRRITDPSLKLWQGEAGRATHTRIALFYVEGAAPPDRVEAVMRRIQRLDTAAVTASGELERALAGQPRGVFPQLLHTERPDRFARELLRGKVGILADGLPVGLLLPVALPELMTAQEDRARHAAVAAALTALRWAALGLSLLLPAVYVAAAAYHPEMIPDKLLLNVIRAKEQVPFSTAAEVLAMLFSFELLQEAGVRLPEPVGEKVSIIGALNVGQSAVEAKVLSPIVIIVVAMAGIAGYTQPSQELGTAVRLWRFILVGCAALLGLFGVMAGLMVLLRRLCAMENLGVGYLSRPGDTPLRRRGGRRRKS